MHKYIVADSWVWGFQATKSNSKHTESNLRSKEGFSSKAGRYTVRVTVSDSRSQQVINAIRSLPSRRRHKITHSWL